MKSTVIRWTTMLLAISILDCAIVYAQPSKPTDSNSAAFKMHLRHNLDVVIQMLSEKLDLTEEKQGSIEAIFSADALQITAVRDDKSMPHEQKSAEIKRIWQKSLQDVNSVLNPQQRQKFAEMEKQIMQPGHNAKRTDTPDSNS